MKKRILILALTLSIAAVFAIAGGAFAEDPAGNLSAVPTAQAGDSLGIMNLNGTTYYIPALGAVAVGSGIEFASLQDGLVGIRGEAVTTVGDEDQKTLFGLGVGVNLPKLFERAGGKWAANIFNPSVNAAIFTSLSGGVKPYFAIGVNVITIRLQ